MSITFTANYKEVLSTETVEKIDELLEVCPEVKLVLAGPENSFFREKVKPLVDGKTVEFAGFVRGAERSRLLGGARALLYPIQYPEAFGLVLVEAMLCGTPVAAMRLGAVPEIVDEGVERGGDVRACVLIERRQAIRLDGRGGKWASRCDTAVGG